MHSVQFPLRNASTLLERVNRVNQLTTKGLDLQHCQVLLLVIELLILLSREAADAAALVLLFDEHTPGIQAGFDWAHKLHHHRPMQLR